MNININGVTRPYTKKELEKLKAIETPAEVIIDDLKNKIAETNEQAIAFAEGALTEEEYAPIKKQRQEWRDAINKLQQ